MCNIEKKAIEKQLNEKIGRVVLLKETSCSFLYHVRADKQYVLKKSKAESIEKEFENHKKVYELWQREKGNFGFKVPEIYFLSSDKKSYLMQYIKGGVNLLEVLFRGRDDTNEIFGRVGRCVNQYHNFATEHLAESREDMLVHDTVRQLLNGRRARKIRRCLDEFGDDTYRIIFKDFTFSNIVLAQSGDIYFLDFQNIYYYAPFYYDLARFVDTAKVFTLVRRPFFFLFNISRINCALKSFLNGYGDGIDQACLRRMQRVHRAEHIQMKANKNKFDSIILTLIYCLI